MDIKISGILIGAIVFISALVLLTTVVSAIGGLTCACGDLCVNETGWWRGGGDFNASTTSIQAAVDNATANDTICVQNGTYTENVNVNKRLTIKSENGSANCVVQAANPNDHVFEVTADYVNISGFTVTKATGSGKCGIYLDDRDHCNISDNNASDNYRGIRLRLSSNNILANNTASNNNGYGIFLWYSSNNNTLTNNTASNNNGCGIYLESSNNAIISGNTANANKYSAYWYPGNGIYLKSSNDCTITGNNASNNVGYGIYLEESSNKRFANNTANANGKIGITLSPSSNSMIANNTANANEEDGIRLTSSNNTITNNTASNNNGYGIIPVFVEQ